VEAKQTLFLLGVPASYKNVLNLVKPFN